MHRIENLDDVRALVRDEIPESIHLDYKRSEALTKDAKSELTKDVSAFANSDGGWIVYGIVEEDGIPKRLDGGVRISAISREWIENILTSNIAPKLAGLIIHQFQDNNDSAYFVIEVPRSMSGPHQALDKKYYRRFNFKSEAMEDYEIRDVRLRGLTVPRLANIRLESSSGDLRLIVENLSMLPARDLRVELLEVPGVVERPDDSLFTSGIPYFPPATRLEFYLTYLQRIEFSAKSDGTVLMGIISYRQPDSDAPYQESFSLDLRHFAITETPPNRLAKDIVKALEGIQDQLKGVEKVIKAAAGSTSPGRR